MLVLTIQIEKVNAAAKIRVIIEAVRFISLVEHSSTRDVTICLLRKQHRQIRDTTPTPLLPMREQL